MNPTLGNNPRWRWESVALFENGDVRVLGFSGPAAFESEWATFVCARYF